MIKKILSTIVCSLFLVPLAFGDKETDRPISLQMYGDVTSVYKQQNNYRSPLDSTERFAGTGTDDGSKVRHGANNRESQTTRAQGSVTLVARGGEKLLDREGNDGDVYEFTGVFKLNFDANDPDHDYKTGITSKNKTLDSTSSQVIKQEDAWIRYSPHLAVGIKIGVQSVAETALPWIIGHKFAGDLDDDFVHYAASALLSKYGLSIDVHPHETITLGYGMFQGMGDASQIASRGGNDDSKTNVYWFHGDFDFLTLTYASQDVSSGGATTDSNDITSYEHKYNHNLTNFALVGYIGDRKDDQAYWFAPFIGVQQISGDKVEAPFQFKTINDGLTRAKSLGLSSLSLSVGKENESRSVEANLNTVGIIANLGTMGKIAYEMTQIDSPDWGEKGMVVALVDLKEVSHLNYIIEPTKDTTITFFYNTLKGEKSSNLRKDIKSFTDNIKILAGAGQDTSGMKTALFGADVSQQTDTTSAGVQFQMKFGN